MQLENLFCKSTDVNKISALASAQIKLGDLGAAVEVCRCTVGMRRRTRSILMRYRYRTRRRKNCR